MISVTMFYRPLPVLSFHHGNDGHLLSRELQNTDKATRINGVTDWGPSEWVTKVNEGNFRLATSFA